MTISIQTYLGLVLTNSDSKNYKMADITPMNPCPQTYIDLWSKSDSSTGK